MDLEFRWRGPRYADPRVVIVSVDDLALAYAKDHYGHGWPVPRRFYGDIVDDLHNLGARTVAFDILISEPSESPADDASLARSCRLAGNVVQACAFQVSPDPRFELPAGLEGGHLDPRFALTGDLPGARRAIWVSPPLPALATSAAAVGHVDVFPEAGGDLRRVTHVVRYRDALYPSLALAAAGEFQELAHSAVTADQRGVTLGAHEIPLDEQGDTYINWIGEGRSYPTFSARDLLLGKVPPDAIRGRLVLVGVTALGAYESRATPFSAAQPVLQFQANAIDDLLSGRSLRTTGPIPLLAFLLVLPTLCSYLTATSSRRGALMSLGVVAGLWVLSLTLLAHDVYLPVGAMTLACCLAICGSLAGGFADVHEANLRNDAAVAALTRGASLLGATLGAGSRERLHAIIRATARDAVGATEVFLILPEDQSLGISSPRLPAVPPSPLDTAAVTAAQLGHTLLWPADPALKAGDSSPWRRLRKLRGVGKRRRGTLGPDADGTAGAEGEEQLFDQAARWAMGEKNETMPRETIPFGPRRAFARDRTLIVAPLPSANAPGESAPRRLRTYSGALIAAGKKTGGSFTARDAALMEALAEQSALALANWEFNRMLQGRVELANRELSDTNRLLSEQSAKLLAAVESIDAALVVTDQDGVAMFVNSAGARVLRGATPIPGEAAASAFVAGDLDEMAGLFKNLRERGTAVEKVRLDATRGNSILSAQFVPLISDENELLGAMLVVTDVSAQRELERMKTDFVAYVAHELRTPLTTILGYATLLDQNAGTLGVERTREMTAVIARHCRRMNRLISDLLDISRIEAGVELPVRRTSFDVKDLCERLVAEYRTQLNARPPIELEVDAPEKPVHLFADPDRVEQVIINLLSNAVKYSPEGGKITAKITTGAEGVAIEVQDHGIGMSSEQVDHLFEKYYRAPEARSRNIKGTGLGLHLVKQIIEVHGGTISVVSRPGAGSTFRVILPRGLNNDPLSGRSLTAESSAADSASRLKTGRRA